MIGLGLSINRGGLLNKFGLSALFKSGETGVIFDPSTTGTLYTTTAMTIPANPGDPVGMMLDQSQWGGAALGSLYSDTELVTNGDFATDVTGWTLAAGGLASVSSGVVTLTNDTNRARLSQTIATEVGKTYRIYITEVGLGNSPAGSVRVQHGATQVTLVGGENNVVFVAASASTEIVMFQNTTTAGLFFSFDDISVREVTVANALAPIAGPELVTNGTFDADTTGWALVAVTTSTQSVVGGRLRLTTQGGDSNARSAQTFSTVVGKTYAYRADGYTGTAVSPPQFKTSGAASINTNFSNGTLSGTFVATTTSLTVTLQNNAGGDGNYAEFDNITVKEIPGYHAKQATAAKRPIYGIHPFGGRRNLLTYSEEFGNALWVKQNSTVTADVVTAPDSTSSADYLIEDTGTQQKRLTRSQSVSGTTATISVFAKQGAGSTRFLAFGVNTTASDFVTVGFSLSDGTVTQTIEAGALTVVSSSSVDAGDGWFRCTVTLTGISVAPGLMIALSDSATFASGSRGSPYYTGDGTSGVYIWGAQVDDSSTATDYQKVTSQYVVTETGVPSVHYLAFDGVDDAMATPSIDFSASDEMSVFAGVRKLSDASVQMLYELSATASSNAGAVQSAPGYLGTFGNVGPYWHSVSKGTKGVTAVSPATFPAPATAVQSQLAKISSDTATLRIDGTQVATSAADQGTGNYGNFPLYIGARATTSNYFNGHLYGLTLRGALSDDPTVAKAEKLVAKKTGVTL